MEGRGAWRCSFFPLLPPPPWFVSFLRSIPLFSFSSFIFGYAGTKRESPARIAGEGNDIVPTFRFPLSLFPFFFFFPFFCAGLNIYANAINLGNIREEIRSALSVPRLLMELLIRFDRFANLQTRQYNRYYYYYIKKIVAKYKIYIFNFSVRVKKSFFPLTSFASLISVCSQRQEIFRGTLCYIIVIGDKRYLVLSAIGNWKNGIETSCSFLYIL